MEAPNRILCLRLQRKKYESEPVERYISYNADRYNLNDEEYAEILNLIPEVWNTEKDQLTYFCLHPDKTFLCSRVKEVYNFSIKETEKKLYNFNGVTEEELNNFVTILTDFYTKLKVNNFSNAADLVIEKLYDMSYLKYSLLEERNKALSETDFMFNRDYVFSDVEKEESWKKYRQEWRDITEQDAWKASDYINVKIPVSPTPRDQLKSLSDSIGSYIARVKLPENIENEITTNFEENFVEVVENYSSIIAKIEIIKRIINLNIPFGFNADQIINLPNFIDIPTGYSDEENIKETPEEDTAKIYDSYIERLNQKMEMINEKLQQYNFNFTIGDILEKHLSDIKEKSLLNDKNEETLKMLEEIRLEEIGL